MLRFPFIAAVLMLACSPAIGQPASNEDQTRNPGERLICKKEETIGSRLAAKKVCLTAREWRDRMQADREQLEKIQSDARAPRSG